MALVDAIFVITRITVVDSLVAEGPIFIWMKKQDTFMGSGSAVSF